MKWIVSPITIKTWTFWFKYDIEKRRTIRKYQRRELKGWHTGAGMSYLYNSDVKHYRDNFWATADMTRLPGTTTLNDMPSTNTKNDKSFVGGTKLNNKYASIGMDFENQDKTLTAKNHISY